MAIDHPDIREPEAIVYMPNVLFNDTHGAVRSLKGILETLKATPSLLKKLSEHTYPEAVDLRDQLIAGLGDLATTLNDVLAQTTATEGVTEPVIAQTNPSLMSMAESGIYFDTRHLIADL